MSKSSAFSWLIWVESGEGKWGGWCGGMESGEEVWCGGGWRVGRNMVGWGVGKRTWCGGEEVWVGREHGVAGGEEESWGGNVVWCGGDMLRMQSYNIFRVQVHEDTKWG